MTADITAALAALAEAITEADRDRHLAGLTQSRDTAKLAADGCAADIAALKRKPPATRTEALKFTEDAQREVAKLEQQRLGASTAAEARAAVVQLEGAARNVLAEAQEHSHGDTAAVLDLEAQIAGATDRLDGLQEALAEAQSALDAPGRPPLSADMLKLSAAWGADPRLRDALPGLTYAEQQERYGLVRSWYYSLTPAHVVSSADYGDTRLAG